VTLQGVPATAVGEVLRLDATHGNVVSSFDAMGRPATPTREQIAALRVAGQPSPPERVVLTGGKLTISVPPQGLVVLIVNKNGKADKNGKLQ
jgi:xylan 1,4-beta-xylosidase